MYNPCGVLLPHPLADAAVEEATALRLTGGRRARARGPARDANELLPQAELERLMTELGIGMVSRGVVGRQACAGMAAGRLLERDLAPGGLVDMTLLQPPWHPAGGCSTCPAVTWHCWWLCVAGNVQYGSCLPCSSCCLPCMCSHARGAPYSRS
jgi:hypothetical protein